MKLKYLVKTGDKYLFANCMNDLASYFNVTISGIKYKITHKLIDVIKIDRQLQDLKFDYIIDKNGVITAKKTDIYNAITAQNTDS